MLRMSMSFNALKDPKKKKKILLLLMRERYRTVNVFDYSFQSVTAFRLDRF
jgi:hypothetical protein